MFKIESYITPILLKYVDKYIQNFKPQDSQVSLWGGAATFNNLDLRLDVLEQELQIPFCFTSGHIHELQIRVPWTKITTEPIVITINTIECILQLRGPNSKTEPSPKQKTPPRKDEEIEAVPPGYVSSLINKIVNNIKINCNNLILKYVEDDIVLSMNVKLLTFQSANNEWKPEYIDFSSSLITLRKLITLSDLTVCIDKRNAAGKIDVYLEPVLYKCFIEMHLLRIYHTATSKISSTTRLDVYCNKMEFSITEQQVPMAMRILMLLIALQQRELRYLMEQSSSTDPDGKNYASETDNAESWMGWAWSFVPALPLSWDEDWDRKGQEIKGHSLHIGGYIDLATITFKVSESSTDHSGYYPQKKMRCAPMLTLQLQGCFMESVMHGLKWFNCRGGISEVLLLPVGHCSCSYSEADEETSVQYLKIGDESYNNKKDSLFDAESVENKGERRSYNISWETHLKENDEQALLARTPAIAMDYVYQLEIPDDYNFETISDSLNLEYSGLVEKSLCKFFVGPFNLCLCSGLFHRLSSLREAASTYDYAPYGESKFEPDLKDLHPASEEDFDALSVFIPHRTYNLSIIKPVIEFQLMDHPYFEPRKGYLFRKRKRISISSTSPKSSVTHLPKVTLECDKFMIKYHIPMYPKRLIYTTCQLPNPPESMFEACHSSMIVAISGLSSRLIASPSKQTILVMPSNITYMNKNILKPKYWVNPNIPHRSIFFEADTFSITGTKPKLLLMHYIIDSFLRREDLMNVTSSTLIADASKSAGMTLLEFCMESIKYRKITSLTTVTHLCSVLSVKAFVIEPPDSTVTGNNEPLQVLILSGPESKTPENTSNAEDAAANQTWLLSILFQCPLDPKTLTHAPIIHFDVSEIQACVDPLLYKWLLYVPKFSSAKLDSQLTIDSQPKRQKTISEASGSLAEMPKRFGTPHESIHSSSDPIYMSTTSRKEHPVQEKPVDIQEKIYNFLMDWILVWRVLIIDGRFSKCIIYFPINSVSAVGSHGIEDAIKNAIQKDPNSEFMVVRLPKAILSSHFPSSNSMEDLNKYLESYPIILPSNFWNTDIFSFPWTISITDFSCFTMHGEKKWNFLSPVSMKATIVLARQIAPKSNRESLKPEVAEEEAGNLSEQQKKKKVNFNEKVVYDRPSNIWQLCGSSLGVCIHIDTSNTSVIISEVQVCVIASVLYGLINLFNNFCSLLPEKRPPPKFADCSILSEKSVTSYNSTIETASEFIETNNTTVTTDTESVKLTALVQWTSARFRVKILSHDADDLNSMKESYRHSPKLKLVFDAEDLMASLDFQNVFLKFKGKIAAASIKHYVMKNGKWRAGPFLGVFMQVREETPEENPLETDDFCSVTITRASCEHAYLLWGTSRKYKLNDSSQMEEDSKQQHIPKRFITEILVTLRPIDIILSPTTLRSYYLVIEPLINVPEPLTKRASSDVTNYFKYLNNQTLPLAYFECTGVRIIVPSVELLDANVIDNLAMFEIVHIKLNPSAVNPICRTPCRPDIYQKAAKKRILFIPGSEVEDRQYQLDIVGISLKTGCWDEIRPVLLDEGQVTHKLKTMSENPALEWNNLDIKKDHEVVIGLNTLPVLSRHNLNIVVAPAIIYKSEMVCGHSVEVNFVSDIDVMLTLSQLKLSSYLYKEFVNVFSPILSANLLRPKIHFLYETSLMSLDKSLEMEEDENKSDEPSIRDSGVEQDFSSSEVTKTSRDINTFISDYEHSLFKNPSSLVEIKYSGLKQPTIPDNWHDVPTDILFTAGNLTFILYDIHRPQYSPITLRKKKFKITPNILPGFLRVKEYQDIQNNDEVPNINMKKVFPEPKKEDEEFLDVESAKAALAAQNKAIAEWKSKIKYTALIFFKISQPNVFISQLQLGNSLQVSVFDIQTKIGSEEIEKTLDVFPTQELFPVVLIETKPGQVNHDTGIPPAFLTFKLTSGFGKAVNLDIDFARPTRILCSLKHWAFLFSIYSRLSEHCFENYKHSLRKRKISFADDKLSRPGSSGSSSKTVKQDNFLKFKEIRDRLKGVTDVQIKTSQISVVDNMDNEAQVNLSFGETLLTVRLHNKPERIKTNFNVKCVTLSVYNNTTKETRLLLNPWTCNMDVLLFWDLWQSTNSDPQIRLNINSDPILIDIGPEHLKGVQVVLQEIEAYKNEFFPNGSSASAGSSIVIPKSASLDKEQHYKDDLRAGAYQFVDATGGVDELPQTYQVKFWSKNVNAMAWKYPQPRALTKVRVFPVPFQPVSGNDYLDSEQQQILCHLEYWSECHQAYKPYTSFYLSESDMTHLDLSRHGFHKKAACIWRVRMDRSNEDVAMISPRALAACMRIDSYFNKALVPNVTAVVNLSSVNISFYNYFGPLKKNTPSLPKCIEQFHYFYETIPENQCFMNVFLQNTNAYVALWQQSFSVLTEVTSNVCCKVLDYGFLCMEPFVQPFNLRMDAFVSDTINMNVATQPIHIRFGPSFGHTLAVSAQMWNNIEQEFVIMTRYVVCNDTNVMLKFGQAFTEEELTFPPRYCYFYCWRSKKSSDPLFLHASLDENGYGWSNPFSIDFEGTIVVEIPSNTSKNSVLIVTVTNISATQKKITFSGQLMFANMLQENFEMKLVLATAENRDLEFKSNKSHVIGKRFSPTMLIDTKEKYSLRLRFHGLGAPWSGDIPLEENAKCLQPWLVKIPLQERGQFLSIWCRVVKQPLTENCTKILVMFWPLFMVRSHLPQSTEMVMETPKLKLNLSVKIKGRGELQQLYCPGTIDLTHILSLENDCGNPTEKIYIPLHYGQVDQNKFFRKSPNENIDEIVSVLNTYDESKWPYFCEYTNCIEWNVEETPVENVQVQYKNVCAHSSALCLELLPWCLMFNTLGCDITLTIGENKIGTMKQYSIYTPPKIEETFHIGVQIDQKLCLSSPLQFAKNTSTDSFFMPKITGLIPLQGQVKTVIKDIYKMCIVSIDSSVYRDMRKIQLSSTHVITNFMKIPLKVVCFVVSDTEENVEIPEDADRFSYKLKPEMHKMKAGLPINSWLILGEEDPSFSYALYICVALSDSDRYSCPVRVDNATVQRKNIYIPSENTTTSTTVTLQEHKGLFYLGVHHDMHPQLLFSNSSGAKLYFAQIISETENKIVKESNHFSWVCSVDNKKECYYTMPGVSEKFPDIIASGNSTYYFVVAVDPVNEDEEFEWSTPICTTNFNDQFVRIPFHGEVKVSVSSESHTTVVDIDSASQVEICARDVRVRLLHASGSENAATNQQETVGMKSKQMPSQDLTTSTESQKTIQTVLADPNKNLSLPKSSGSQTYQTETFSYLPPLTEKASTKSENVASKSDDKLSTSTSISIENAKNMKIQIYVATVSFTLMNDLKKTKEEVAALILDNLLCTAEKEANTEILITASDIQLDNRLYNNKNFDFPVVLINQEPQMFSEKPLTHNFYSDDFHYIVQKVNENALITINASLCTWYDSFTSSNVTRVKEIKIQLKPISSYIEDKYITALVEFCEICSPQNLIVWANRNVKKTFNVDSRNVCVPEEILWQANVVAQPLSLSYLCIEPVSVCLSVHSSVKMYIALDQSPLTFAKFERKDMITTPYKLGHALTVHFLSGAIFRAGWVVGSLELLGSPGGLARAMGSGLRDFINMPYRGLVQGPWAFLKGITHGSASLMRHITAGTLHSMTQFASSVARNLDRLSLDQEHLRRTEEQRRNRPHGLAEGLWQGLSSFGISLLGAVAGIAHHPMQSVISGGATPGGLAAGVGLGLVGVFVKPLGGAAEFLALTGQGLLEGAGWHTLPTARVAITNNDESDNQCTLKLNWKYPAVQNQHILFSLSATAVPTTGEFEAVELMLTTSCLIIINSEFDSIQRIYSLTHLEEIVSSDTTLLCFRLLSGQRVKDTPVSEELGGALDPVSRARVAEYVKNTVLLVRFPSTETSPVHSEMSISSSDNSRPTTPDVTTLRAEPTIKFHVNPQYRDYFYSLVRLLKRQKENTIFEVL